MARIVTRPADHKTASTSPGGDARAFANIDAAHLETARQDPTVRRFAKLADGYFSVLRRDRRIRQR